MSRFSESVVEDAALEWLESLGLVKDVADLISGVRRLIAEYS